MKNYQIKNECLTVTISSRGAELQSIIGSDKTEYLWQGDEAIWKDKAFNIFPYIARLYQGTYQYEGQEYKLPIHGFLKDSELTVAAQTEESITFNLTDGEETKAVYPFEFSLDITYTLQKNKIEIIMSVANQGEQTMYFGIGGHPGFIVPIAGVGQFDDYYLEFATKETPYKIGVDGESLLQNGNDEKFDLVNQTKLPLSHETFNDDAIILHGMSKEVTLKSDANEKTVTVSYPDMNFLGIWQKPHTTAEYVCIEPWTSLQARMNQIEDISKQTNMISLKSNQRYDNKWSITIKE